jgi:hypothetical protein
MVIIPRITLSGADLDRISKCEHSFNYLKEIESRSDCDSCCGLRESGKYILQRGFKGGSQPSLKTAVKKYRVFSGISSQLDDKKVNSIVQWSNNNSNCVNTINIDYELHLGRFTIKDKIDGVLFKGQTYKLIVFGCDKKFHGEVLTYKNLAASLWLRMAFNVNSNSVISVRPNNEVKDILIPLSSEEIAISLRKILDRILVTNTLDLPISIGSHCSVCMSCIYIKGSNICG